MTIRGTKDIKAQANELLRRLRAGEVQPEMADRELRAFATIQKSYQQQIEHAQKSGRFVAGSDVLPDFVDKE